MKNIYFFFLHLIAFFKKMYISLYQPKLMTSSQTVWTWQVNMYIRIYLYILYNWRGKHLYVDAFVSSALHTCSNRKASFSLSFFSCPLALHLSQNTLILPLQPKLYHCYIYFLYFWNNTMNRYTLEFFQITNSLKI